MRGGWSTLELLLSLCIIVIVLSGATQVVMGNTEFAKDTRFSQAALHMADRNIEVAEGELHTDWSGGSAYAGVSEDMYEKTITITDISSCMKEVVSLLDWDYSQLRPGEASITTLVSSPDEVRKMGGNCNTTPPSDWDHPGSYGAIDFAPSGGQARDIDVVNKGSQRIAFLASYYSATAKPDFMIFDVTDPTSPSLISEVDLGVTLNSIVAAGEYVFGAADRSTRQLVVIDVSDLALPSALASTTLSGVSGSYPEGRTIAFYDDTVYVGTRETAGPEFHAFDVGTPSAPSALDSLELTHSIYDIAVANDHAYLATTADAAELIVVDVSNPSNLPDPLSSGTYYNARATDGVTESARDGTAVFVLGDRAYLGRLGSGQNDADEHEFFILDVSTPTAITKLGSLELNLKTNENVVGLAVSGRYAFIVANDTNAGFQVWDIDNPSAIVSPSSCENKYNYPEKATGFDFVDNFGFVSNEANKALRVIYDDPSCTP